MDSRRHRRSRSRTRSREESQSQPKDRIRPRDASPVGSTRGHTPPTNNQRPDSPSKTPATPATTAPGEAKGNEDNPLDPEIAELLGKRLDPDVPLGPAINENIVIRWNEIISKGLPKEEQKEIIKKYATPENCKLVNAPRLNPEIKASMPEGAISRDVRLVAKQTKLSICLSALGQALDSLVNLKKDEPLQPDVKKSCLGIISDTCRLLLEVQREESLTRRALALPNMNATIKAALHEVKFGELLFDKDIETIIKTSKLLEKTSKDLKDSSKPKSEPSKNEKRPLYSQTSRTRQRSSGQGKSWNQEKPKYRRPPTRQSFKRDSSYRKRK